MKRFFSVYLVILFAACTSCGADESFFKSQLGQAVEITGKALTAKTGALLETEHGQIGISGLVEWPGELEGKNVKVAGTVGAANDLPVFIRKEGEPEISGIPLEEGTDLEQAKQRFVILNAKWQALK